MWEAKIKQMISLGHTIQNVFLPQAPLEDGDVANAQLLLGPEVPTSK